MNTRFAPSPTAQLHLGHVAAVIHVWGLAARCRAAVDVRIEDHDRVRCRPEHLAALQADLEWLGFEPARGGRWSQQTLQEERYRETLSRLRDQNLVYACRCSRKDSITETGSIERRYVGTCRELHLSETSATCLRVRLPDVDVQFFDARHGWQTQRPSTQCGDPVIRDRLGQWTYQFAVVVDDLCDDIDWVIRGDDLLPSTGRQILLARLLDRRVPLAFYHHPLVVNADGSKLSKRDAAAPIRALRDAGLSPSEVIGHAAQRCGLIRDPAPMRTSELDSLFSQIEPDEVLRHPYDFGDCAAGRNGSHHRAA
jgi:glutamyl-tRNA synthetase/glutamyl-Q tRNA(Asp) synthetase